MNKFPACGYPKSAIYRKRHKEIAKDAKFLILIINTLRPLR